MPEPWYRTASEVLAQREEADAARAERENFRTRYGEKRLVSMIRTLTQIVAGSMVREEALSEEEMEAIADLFPDYAAPHNYRVGDVFNHHGVLYEVIQDHDSQEGWSPADTPALYKRHSPDGLIPQWVQPTGAHDAYDTGERVEHEGVVYESQIDANTTVPGTDERWWVPVGRWVPDGQ